MKLTINNAGEPHFGKYTCVAKNPRGQTDGSITLYGEFGAFSLPATRYFTGFLKHSSSGGFKYILSKPNSHMII